MLKSVDVKADTVMNSLLSRTTSTDSSLFEKRVHPLNTDQNKSKANLRTSKEINDDESIMDDYDTLGLDKWTNHDELYAAFNAGLTIPTPGRVANPDL